MTSTNSTRSPSSRRLFLSLFIIGYGVFLGDLYSTIYFPVWLVTHILILSLFIVTLLWPALRSKSWPATPLDGPLLGLGLVMALSTLLSAWPRLALEALFPWLSQILAFYLVVKLMRSGWADPLRRALLLVTGVVVIMGWFELATWYFGLPFLPGFAQGWWQLGGLAQPIPPTWYRLNFTLNNPVVLSAYLVLVLPLAATQLIITRHPADRFIVALFLCAGLVVFVSTFSRSGLIGLGVGLSVLLGLWAQRRSRSLLPRQRSVLFAAVGLGLSLLLALLALLVWTIGSQRVSGDAIRLALWQAALYLYQQYPLVGIGPGLFRWGWRFSPLAPSIADRYVTAHSLYLHQLAEVGTLGVLAGAWLLASAGRAGWKTLHSEASFSPHWWRRAGCAAGLAGFLAQGLFETFGAWPVALPVIILTAYLIAPAPAPRLRLSVINGLVLATLWLGCAVLVTYFAWPRSLAEQARTAATRNERAQAMAAFNEAHQLDPHLALYGFELAEQLAQLTSPDFETAQTVYQHTLALEATYGLNYANLAAVEWNLGQREAALEHVVAATRLTPTSPQFWLARGFYAEETGNTAQAVAAYAQALQNNITWLGSSFWQATPWRKNNFAAVLAGAKQNLPPPEQVRLDFEYNLQRGNLAQAETSLRNLPQENRNGYTYDLLSARLALAQQNLPAALEHTRQAGQKEPTDSSAPALQAEVLFELGQLAQAETAAKYSLFLNPNDSQAYYILGRIRETQQNFPAAEAAYWRGYPSPSFSLDYSVAMYRQLAPLLPLPALPKIGPGESAARAWLALAGLYQKQNRWSEAGRVYTLLLADDPYLDSARTALTRLCQAQPAHCPPSSHNP